ncbi:MAG TPA: bifunctional [glutamate--ammonia ligase]-adenylyl-L-tyrosine phosphorylase/[glutamate--ammonia-ligase] adenylyltransferase [Acidiferrobacterales bacterium]|nr:bifunctional [glutamate--ammonia ligase]-adenylyl-L-tyrosine phosphorylase/[glutamate--ammonia-ligase] adenylyltransferase [Acidiferrobacterales bacterium]
MTDSQRSAFEQGLAKLPEALRAHTRTHGAVIAAQLADLPVRAQGENWLDVAPRVLAVSEFVARACETRPELLPDLIQCGDLFCAYASGELRRRVQAAVTGCADEATLKTILRKLRQREMVRIAWRDLAGWANLEETVTTLSALADACLDETLAKLYEWACARDGVPKEEASGETAKFVVLGMGKLGGEELNFSSDIDLIFCYSEEGETDKRGLSNHEFFVRLGQRLNLALNEQTADGFVFRVDMRLRPNGASGPLALSFDAMEQYYQAHGRMWERYAFIKARVVAGDPAAGAEILQRLRPFVFRKYLDYTAVEEIRALKTSIHRELLRKGIESNIKLGPGGIREVEFIGQAFQLIRGGRDLRFQGRRILPVLAHLADEGDLTPQAVSDLSNAYVFLRNTEHRLQEIRDQQTQVLPTDDLDRLRVAVGMGFGDWPGFQAALTRHMQRVHEHFNSVFAAPQGEAPAADEQGLHALWAGTLEETAAHEVLQAAGFADAGTALDLLKGLRAGGAYSALSANGRERLDKLMPLLLGAAGLTPQPQTTLARLVAFVEAIGRRSVYLALLVENPLALSQLVKLCSASEWIARYLNQHPILLDELMDAVSLYAPLMREALAAELQSRLARLPVDDLEAQMEAMREFRNGHVLRVAAADVGPGLAPDEIGRHLGHIAEVIVAQALTLAHDDLVLKHGRPTFEHGGETINPGFAVIAYGKLGSLELGYTSDLDMIFLHGAEQEGGVTDGARPIANEVFFARLGQRLIHILTARTGGGILYEVDTRLRPSGRSGMLVTNPAAFREYQDSHAWAWEHQALIRARPIAGDAALARVFEEIRATTLCRERDPETLRTEVAAMRARMHAAQAPHDPGEINLKHDPGGMIDVEFMVQYAVLRWAHDHPELIRHRGNIPLLEALEARGLLNTAQAGLLRDAYHRYLGVEQRLKLMERRPLVAPQELGDFPQRVRALWQEWFE